MKSPALRNPRRNGFTLIEVAIALAIFVIGALAIIRIFPGALGVVQGSGERATAMNLSRTMLAAYTNSPETLPRAIYDDSSIAANWLDPANPGATIGTSTRNQALPRLTAGTTILDNFDKSALGHFKAINGERHTLRAGQAFFLTNFPNDGNVDIYEEGEVRNVRIPAITSATPGTLDFSKATFVRGKDGDSFNCTTKVPATGLPADYITDTVYYVTYSYTQGGYTWKVVDEPYIYTGANNDHPLVQAVRDPLCVNAQSVSVRYRRQLANYTAGSTDESMCGYIDVSSLTFPAGHARGEGTQLSVDYLARDWRWMVDDTQLNGDDTFERVLPVRHIDDTLSPSTFGMLWKDKTTAVPSSNFGDSSDFSRAVTGVDDKSATVSFASTTVGASPGSRTVYRTLDNWTMQPSVASDSYLLHEGAPTTANGRQEPWRYCALDGANLYFPPSEAGKCVSITYSYLDGTNNIELTRLFVIGDNTIPVPGGVPADFATAFPTVSSLLLTEADGDDLTAVTSIGAIRGASVQARTAWLNGERFEQASMMSYRSKY